LTAARTQPDYNDLAQQIIERAIAGGADAVECNISEGEQFSVSVRMREIESLTEAGSRAAGLRVLIGKRAGSAYTSDLSRDGVTQMIESALAIASVTSEDPFAGLPDSSELGEYDGGDLGMYSTSIEALPEAVKIEQAKAAEAAALESDPRISNSEGASFETHLGFTLFANSLGFSGSYRSGSCSLSVVPVAKDGKSMERDFWYSIARSTDKLEKAEAVGRRAAQRALRRLGARKVPTQKVPVVFEPRAARSLLDNIFEAVNGDSIYRNESFLAGKLGQTIANSRVTVIDDGTIPGLFGTCPFDDEGVPSRRTSVIENGVLRNYLLNTYTARKLGMKTTGNASRGLTGNAGVGHGNFYLENGDTSPSDIIKSLSSGFYVTELIGFGVNIVTGDYSRGATGIWIENGELTYPVAEVTIAATLQEMLPGIEAVGSDLEFRGSIASPTLLIREMTVSGQ
jgi:PmbA protein